MKEVIEAIHEGTLIIEDWEDQLLNVLEVKRLHHISHLGLAHLVYPGARHSRYGSTVGTFYLAKNFLDKLQTPISSDEKKELFAATILQNTFHGPFCHVFVDVWTRFFKSDYSTFLKTRIDMIMNQREIKEVLQQCFDSKIDSHIKNICDAIYSRDTRLYQLLSGPLGFHRLDYYCRDPRYCGIPTGKIDIEDIMSGAELVEINPGTWRLRPRQEAMPSVEDVILLRPYLYYRIYSHPQLRIAESMLVRAIEKYIGGDKNKLIEVSKFIDYELLAVLKDNGDKTTERIVEKIELNKMYKRLGNKTIRWAHLFPDDKSYFSKFLQESFSTDEETFEKLEKKADDLERELIKEIGLITGNKINFGEIIVDINKPFVDPLLHYIPGLSPVFTSTIPTMEKRNWIIAIYYDDEILKEDHVLKAVEEVMNREVRKIFERGES